MKALDVVAFRPIQVTVIITAVYAVLFAVLFNIHSTVPKAPSDVAPFAGINQSEAWHDLQELSSAYRPWNSVRNGDVKVWLSDRIEELVLANKRDLTIISKDTPSATSESAHDVVLWRDDDINVTVIDSRRQPPLPAYIQSQNIVLYVRGSEDEAGQWWEQAYTPRQGVLINAHYDSVSTGYGATDDGVGVITVLQLISYFTVKHHQPRRGIIFLLNNGEEDGLFGASTFTQHPVSSFPGVFLNLEGAGAGGRAALFRSTDTAVTKLYRSANPFGTVLTADGFKRGLVRSDTDYTVFTRSLDIRGLDIAFLAPRSRYHTDQDVARETSRDSVWHMLSAAISTTSALTEYKGELKPLSAIGHDSGVWFDIFGAVFIVSSLGTFSALCTSALIVGPILLGLIVFFIFRYDRWYPFLPTAILSVETDGETTTGILHSKQGFFRTPIVLITSGLVLVVLAELVAGRNPYIMYRSPLTQFGLLLTSAVLASWSGLKLAEHTRPTVFTRWYSLLWLYGLSWVLLLAAANQATSSQLGGGYPALVSNFTAWLALSLGTVEFVVLPRRTSIVEEELEDDLLVEAQPEPEEPSEQTPLLQATGDTSRESTTGVARLQDESAASRVDAWLAPGASDETLRLTSWMWLLQFLILGPINIVLLGQIALFTMSALHQTPADGNPVSTIFQAMILLALLSVVPALPFLHKLRGSLAALLLLVLLGCFIWSTSAFPFSREARLKYYFLQQVDLQRNVSKVSLTSIQPFLRTIAEQAPSVSGQHIHCTEPGKGFRRGLTTCEWHADAHDYNSTLVSYSVSSVSATQAVFSVQGQGSKSCRIIFDSPVESIAVQGGATDTRHPDVSTYDAMQIRLYGRETSQQFDVNVTWSDGGTRRGRIGCVWSGPDRVPAIQELKLFAPSWSAITKNDDGLVEGWYDWSIPE